MTKIQNKLIDTATGNQLGSGPQARAFFEMRGYDRRKPGQDNIGGCALWTALKNAASEAGNAELIAQIETAQRDANQILDHA